MGQSRILYLLFLLPYYHVFKKKPQGLIILPQSEKLENKLQKNHQMLLEKQEKESLEKIYVFLFQENIRLAEEFHKKLNLQFLIRYGTNRFLIRNQDNQ